MKTKPKKTIPLIEVLTAVLTKKQRALKKIHGTPHEYAQISYNLVPGALSMEEARAMVDKYCQEWEEEGKP